MFYTVCAKHDSKHSSCIAEALYCGTITTNIHIKLETVIITEPLQN